MPSNHGFEWVLSEVRDEVLRASAAHLPMNSAHEAYAVILEELQEFWAEVVKRRAARSRVAMAKELVQTAAMAVRALVDLGLFADLAPELFRAKFEATSEEVAGA